MDLHGHSLMMEPSRLYLRGMVLRHPLTLETVATPNSKKAARQYARRHGCILMKPLEMDMQQLEEKI